MKRCAWIGAFAGAILPAATVLAASGAESDGVSILMILFIGFGALIISFQAILVGVLLFSMGRAVFTKPVETHASLATERADHHS